MSPLTAMHCLWIAWILSWIIAAPWSNRTVGRPKLGSQLTYRLITACGVWLLFLSGRRPDLAAKFWDTPPAVSWFLVGMVAAGVAFTWWARIYLGRMWSSTVTRKADHQIVDTGPKESVEIPMSPARAVFGLDGKARARRIPAAVCNE